MQSVSILKLLNFIVLSSLFFLSSYKILNAEMTSLGVLTGGTSFSSAAGVSSDGSVIVGGSDSTDGSRAFKYVDGTMTSLGILPGGTSFSQAVSVSSDGSVIVGFSESSSSEGYQAFKYDSTNGMTGLGFLTGGTNSYANDVSGDG